MDGEVGWWMDNDYDDDDVVFQRVYCVIKALSPLETNHNRFKFDLSLSTIVTVSFY